MNSDFPLSKVVLLPPDQYIYIGWGIMAVLTLLAVLVLLRLQFRRARREQSSQALRPRRTRKHSSLWLAVMLPLLCLWVVFIYGVYVGFYQFEVRRVELTFDDLPPSFDGYKIVLWSDAHVGTLTGSRKDILKRAVDSINAQQADIVVFAGDLQNSCTSEITPHRKVLSSIKARNGVFSVLGNHDYPIYNSAADDFERIADFGRRCSTDEELGWQLLMNSHRTIRRGDDRLVIAGMENDGKGRFPKLGNIQQALSGVRRSDFVVMIEHDPSAWRRKILPHCHAQLTLSGHTHAMQFALFGWTPAIFMNKEASGLYKIGERAIYVSKGLSGVIPFRFGTPGEIVVITLRK